MNTPEPENQPARLAWEAPEVETLAIKNTEQLTPPDPGQQELS